MSSPAKYARNGALVGIGLYLLVAIPLLALSLGYSDAPAHTASPMSVEMPVQLGQGLAAVRQS